MIFKQKKYEIFLNSIYIGIDKINIKQKFVLDSGSTISFLTN